MKIGLVLEGGAIKGSYQIGSYMAFLECGVKFSGFAGASIGAFNAALLACGKHKELLEFWQSVDPGSVIGADELLIKAINSEQLEIGSLLKGTASSLKKWVKSKGIPVDPLIDILNEHLVEEELRNSDKEFGLVTVKLKGMVPKYIYKEDIPKGKLYDYILASCYLPVFKLKKVIDDSIYLDGGFYDNCPVSLLLNKNFDKVYAIKIKGIGISRRVNDPRVVYITPSRNICKTFEMKKSIINENIKMGYYDTLRVLKNYDGYKYVFKKRSDRYYKRLLKNISKREYERIKNYFKK